MKKLLSLLATVGLTATASTSVLACSTPNKEDHTKAVLEEIKEITSNPESLFFQTKDIKSEDVQNKIKDYLKEYESSLKFTEVKFTGVSINKEGVNPGNLELKISLDGNTLINPVTQEEVFQFAFINEGYKNYSQFNNVLAKLKKGANVDLSNFIIDLQGQKTNIGQIFNFIGSLVKSNHYIPDKIPLAFDDTDESWVQWEKSVKEITKLLNTAKINDQINVDNINLEGPVSVNLAIKTKISDILYSILPDLIHFRNFMLEQREVNQNENILLLLIQYLFETPKGIKEDGFEKINQSVPDINHQGQTISFKTNLERLFHDLLEGWQNANGVWWHAKDEKNNDKETVSITATVFAFVKISIRYQSLNKDGIPDQCGLKDLLPVENIKKFINQLLNYDLNTKTTLTIMLPEIFVGMGGPTDIAIDLGYSIKNSLATILNADSSLTGQLDNLKFEWKKGILKIEILNQEGKWAEATDFANLLTARDFRVKFIENVWEVKYSDLTFEIENTEITLNLDLQSSVIC